MSLHSIRLVCLLICLTWLLIVPASASPTIDDFLRSTGKIYVVVASLAVIFLLIVVYLIVLDRRIQKLENSLPDGKNQ